MIKAGIAWEVVQERCENAIDTQAMHNCGSALLMSQAYAKCS